MRVNLSFQSRVLTGCLLVVVCTLVFIAFLAESWWRDRLISGLKQSLNQHLVLFAEIVAHGLPKEATVRESDRLAEYLGRLLPNLRITFIGVDGVVKGDSEIPVGQVVSLENHLTRPEVADALKLGHGESIRYSTTLNVDLLYVARRFDGPKGPLMVIRAALPLSEVQKSLAQIRLRILTALLLAVLLSLAAAYLVSRGISRPLKDLARTAGAIADGDLSRRFLRLPPHEIGDLGRAFNQMAEELQGQIEGVTKVRDRLEAVLAGMVEGVLLLDQKGKVLLANRALCRMLDVPDPVGGRVFEAIRNPELLDALRKVREGQLHVSGEITSQSLPARYLEMEVVRLAGPESEAEVVAVLHDITQRKRTEKMRRDFVANVSHELRTPLTAIRGSAETLSDGALNNPEDARRFLAMIKRQTLRLEQLATDLLELAHLEAGLGRPEKEKIDAVELARGVLGAMGGLASTRQVELTAELPAEEIIFWAERRHVEQALTNLLDNALKYTKAGGRVTLGLSRADREIRFVVADTGIGIAPEHLDRIFERFYRVDRDRSREMGGTGLGLAIVKHVAKTHNGRVEVESRPGQGSTFRLILPA